MKKNIEEKNDKTLEIKFSLTGSLRNFTQVFYKARTGRDFEIPEPTGRESHYRIIFRELSKVLRGETKRLIINVPPRYGKTECVIHFVAWALAQFPDSNFLYISYSHSLAKKQTQTIRDIVTMPMFKKIFGVSLKDDSQAKDNFETANNGAVYAAGSGGTITGRGAGLQNVTRFGGAIIIDDIHKPDEITSDTIREGVIDWYYNTLQSRLNSLSTPIVFIGQRLHEDDLPAHLIQSGDWKVVSLKAIDDAGNALNDKMHDIITLRKMQEESPYVFASQYQQDPQPSGGGIFKKDWFIKHEIEPNIINTFITVDTAETDKSYNDATVFSFWGLYKIVSFGVETDLYGLHWLDCREIRIEPKDLQHEFLNFYHNCMFYKVRPHIAAIEKKSTGVTLISALREMQGLQILEIERTKASGNKVSRYLEMQPYIASKRISLPIDGEHTPMCIRHMTRITANDTHRHDDICDTLYDAVKIGLINNTISAQNVRDDYTKMARDMSSYADRIDRLRKSAYQ